MESAIREQSKSLKDVKMLIEELMDLRGKFIEPDQI
jgi:hypothetical protein